MKRHLRTGFTLVELLVVITIIGMLMALLLPAVNSARESGRRADCLNQITQLCKATINYESRGQGLPGYLNAVKTTSGATNNSTWVVMLFPFIERNDVWKKYTSGTPVATDKPFMELMVCKSDPPESQSAPFLSYVANCGIPDGTDKNSNGVFFNRTASGAPGMSLDPGLFPDGTTNTLMYSENIQADKWDASDASAENKTGFVWHNTTSPSTAQRINGDKISTTINSTYARPSSFHPGGVNVATCGGDGRWLREDIDYKVYQQLMTPDGSKSDMPAANKSYILNDADWK